MRLRFILISILSIFISANAFAANNTDPSQKDREILTWVIAIDKYEIAAAKEVHGNNVSPAVKDYATWMRSAHSKNLRDAIKLSHKLKDAPLKTQLVTTLQDQGKTGLDNLKPLKGKELQTTYINMMVQGHTNAIQTIDQDLLKNASNPEVKNFLTLTRAHIVNHLEKAKAIQEQLASS